MNAQRELERDLLRILADHGIGEHDIRTNGSGRKTLTFTYQGKPMRFVFCASHHHNGHVRANMLCGLKRLIRQGRV